MDYDYFDGEIKDYVFIKRLFFCILFFSFNAKTMNIYCILVAKTDFFRKRNKINECTY